MKTSIKTLACAFAASIVLVSCNNENPQDGPSNKPSIKAACKELYGDPYPDLDPACRSEDRIQVEVRDEQEIVFEVDGVYYNSVERYNNVEKCAKGVYLNGEYVSANELEHRFNDNWELKESIRDEYLAYYERRGKCVELIWDLLKEARDIAVPCLTSVQYIDRVWNAMLTEEEIAELKKTYNISIVHMVPVNDGGAENDTPIGGNGGDALDPCYVEEISSSSSSLDNSIPPSITEIPVMDSRVVSYQSRWNMNGYYDKLGYRNGFTADKDILKSWFPDIFNDELAESECNYFALYFTGSSSGLIRSYEILSQDMVYMIGCTWKGTGVSTGDFARRAMLICDDKAGTLRKSIDLDSIRFYNDPGWECESGKGGPNLEDMYF